MITDLLKQKRTLSFEVYPPKKEDEFEAAYQVLDSLGGLNPDFISVTYGAGGSNSKKTVELASYIQNNLKIDALAHMTCVGCKKELLMQVSEELKAANVTHVLALRGDRPKDMTDEQFESRDFAHANDMMAFLKEHTELHLAGACYPEKHYECFSMETDLNNLKRKQDAGAEFLITQLFFDNDFFYSFREKAQKKGITIPICAGIMPITTPKQIGTTITLSGSSIPKELADIVAKYGDNADDIRKAGTDYAIRQILDLQANDADGIHIYCMNRPKTTAAIVEAVR
ncbi:MAG: methylenetetrahydrofolate reductase [NAD(P)H] [Bacteroidales bacterium]|nr:methylenetetrahydrofolate reductase [NAD(P)H] [Lachnoclostridium sp.]MCM1385424.1 methylenetetrahydrofolate reductase [NAD(P)H] [Lachnoclostridium sp.]MCM1464094.1 methylenetetrahydrofolate reductase [NAD(P)H] [Bacteroidales bacterium]